MTNDELRRFILACLKANPSDEAVDEALELAREGLRRLRKRI